MKSCRKPCIHCPIVILHYLFLVARLLQSAVTISCKGLIIRDWGGALPALRSIQLSESAWAFKILRIWETWREGKDVPSEHSYPHTTCIRVLLYGSTKNFYIELYPDTLYLGNGSLYAAALKTPFLQVYGSLYETDVLVGTLMLQVRTLFKLRFWIFPLITYFRYHVTEFCAVIGTHSTVRGDKLLYGHVPDPFPWCRIVSGHVRLGNIQITQLHTMEMIQVHIQTSAWVLRSGSVNIQWNFYLDVEQDLLHAHHPTLETSQDVYRGFDVACGICSWAPRTPMHCL